MGTVGGGTSTFGTITPFSTRSVYTCLNQQHTLRCVLQYKSQSHEKEILRSIRNRVLPYFLAQFIECRWHVSTCLRQGFVLCCSCFHVRVGTAACMAKLNLKAKVSPSWNFLQTFNLTYFSELTNGTSKYKFSYLWGEHSCTSSDTPCYDGFVESSVFYCLDYFILFSATDLQIFII